MVGNHDYVNSGAGGYFNYFGAAAGDPTEGYYDYRLGAWHVIVLNSNCAAVGGCGAGSAAGAVAPRRPGRHPTPSAPWPSGTTPGSARGPPTAPTPPSQPFWQALYDYGADVVLNGHDHLYERFGPQTPTAPADAVYGLRQFIVGTGGRSSYSFGTAAGQQRGPGAGTYGVLKMILHDNSYDWEFVPVAGQTFTDAGTSACHGAPAADTAASAAAPSAGGRDHAGGFDVGRVHRRPLQHHARPSRQRPAR